MEIFGIICLALFLVVMGLVIYVMVQDRRQEKRVHDFFDKKKRDKNVIDFRDEWMKDHYV